MPVKEYQTNPSRFSAQIPAARLLDLCKKEREALDRLAPDWNREPTEYDSIQERLRMTIAKPAGELEEMIAALAFLGDQPITLDQEQILFYKSLQEGEFVAKAMQARRYFAQMIARMSKPKA